MSADPEHTAKSEAIERLLDEVQRLETQVSEIAARVKLTWARAQRRPLTPEQQAQVEAAAPELTKVSASIKSVDFEVPPVTDAERDRLLDELQALFSHIPPGVSLADELIAERRREAERELRG